MRCSLHLHLMYPKPSFRPDTSSEPQHAHLFGRRQLGDAACRYALMFWACGDPVRDSWMFVAGEELPDSFYEPTQQDAMVMIRDAQARA